MRTLRGRLFLALALAVVVSVGVTLAVGSVLVRKSVERSRLASLARQADVLAGRGSVRSLGPGQEAALRLFFGRQGIAFDVIAPFDRQGVPPLPRPVREAIEDGRAVEGTFDAGGGDRLWVARPGRRGTIVLSRPAGVAFADWRPFAGGFLVAAALGVGLASILSWLVARVVARPVGRVADATRRLAGGEIPAAVPVEGPAEIAGLASSFNAMSTELLQAREAEQAFLLSVSHELKTPLTAIRGYSEGLVEGAVPTEEAGRVISAEAGRLERLVQDLLDLARLNRRAFSVHADPIDLGAVAREAVRRHEPRAREFRVGLAVDGRGPAPAVADEGRVLQVVSNLVENALRVVPAGGKVTVEAGPGRLVVRDTGPGLAPEDLPRAFERFYLYERYGRERPVGTGLGLAIVKELTEAMGGWVEVESRREDGTAFTVRLPVSPTGGG